MAYSQAVKSDARRLYLAQWTVTEIAQKLNLTEPTVYNWAKANNWDDLCPPDTAEIIVTRRLNLLANRENKTDAEIKEFEALCRSVGKMQVDLATAEKIKSEAKYIEVHGVLPKVSHILETDAEGNTTQSKSRGRKKQVKNDISGVTKEQLDEIRNKLFYSYQIKWHQAKQYRNRIILKSRQIGATYYFGWEPLEDAILTGDNQVFLSASRDQAEIFKAYIIAFAKEHLDIELKGTGVILLSNGAELRFLSTNGATAQGYHGHLYVDEFLHIMNFAKLNKLASGIAAHKKWRKTYFSTPSALTHPAWKLWDGSKFNERFKEKDRKKFDISHAALKDGAVFADGIWRNIVTVEDADAIIKLEIAQGKKSDNVDLFDIEQLKLEYSQAEYDNLFMAKPIDDSQSVFPLNLLMGCMVEAEEWADYKPHAALPFGNKSVAFGYDPSKTGDGAALAILDVPPDFSKPFRVLESYVFHGKNFTFQDNEVHAIADKHNICHFGMDNTGGTGITMCEKFTAWFPLLTTYYYSPQVKGALIGKMLDLMSNGRFKYLAHKQDITRSFMLITQSSTESGGAITYKSGRTSAKDSGENTSKHKDHADAAWSCMHACMVEPVTARRGTTVTFSD